MIRSPTIIIVAIFLPLALGLEVTGADGRPKVVGAGMYQGTIKNRQPLVDANPTETARSSVRQASGSGIPTRSAPKKSLVEQVQHVINSEPMEGNYYPDSGYCCDRGPMCGCEAICGCEAMCGCEPGCGCETGCGFGGCDAGCCAGSSCDMFGCDSCDYGGAAACCGWDPCNYPVLFINWSRFDFFAGFHSFSNPLNYQGTGTAEQRDGTGSFGFHEGFNYGKCLPWLFGGELSGQFGLRATHSNLDGAEFTDDERQQIFLTAGLFRRVDFGLQGGVVFDYLYDEWNYRANATQLRGELSWRTQCPTEIGYRFAVGTNRPGITTVINDHINAVSSTSFRIRATEQHRLFYRRYFSPAAFGELSVGVTDNADALFGGQIDVPLNCQWGLTTGFTWAIGDGRESIDHQQESWNMFVGMMYRPAGNRNRKDYHAPLLPVADNGSMILNRF